LREGTNPQRSAARPAAARDGQYWDGAGADGDDSPEDGPERCTLEEYIAECVRKSRGRLQPGATLVDVMAHEHNGPYPEMEEDAGHTLTALWPGLHPSAVRSPGGKEPAPAQRQATAGVAGV
jgi:hypothetical protein